MVDRTKNGMKVVELSVENYMGIKAVMIRPTGNVVRIEGKNRAGKSTVIDAIWVALAGMGESGIRPLRNGEKKGRAFVDLGDIRVERKFTENNTYLEVSDKEGRRIPRPQEFLDQFYSKTTIDPRNFINLNPNERRDLLLDLTGNRDEIEILDSERASLYEERTLVNREIKTLQGKVAGNTWAGRDIPAEETPIADLLEKLKVSIQSDSALVADRGFVEQTKRNIENKNAIIERCQQQIAGLKRQIEEVENEIQCMGDDLDAAEDRVKNTPDSDTDNIRAQIAEAEKSNVVLREYKQVAELNAQLIQKQRESERITDSIREIDERKVEILNESALSIGVVEFDGDTLIVDGGPFDDLSTSEQLLVSLEIAVSQKPRIRVVRVSDGNVFDEDSMNAIEQWADEHDCQLWIERVGSKPDGLGFFIKDGSLEEETE